MKHAGLALILLAASQAASAQLFSDSEARQRIEALRQDNTLLQQKIQTLDERIAKLEAGLRSQGMLDLLQGMEAMKADLAKLRGQIEVNTYNIDTAQKRQKDLYVDLDNRLRKVERVDAPVAAPSGAVPPPTVAPVGTPATATPPSSSKPTLPAAPTAPTADNVTETRAYEAAFNLFKIGNYQAAIPGFQNFITAYPASPLAANAQYWIGNSYSALREYKNAIQQQQKLISTYPNSPKVPDAMLNIASSQAEIGDRAGARKTLEDIIAKHPLSPAAENAKKRLANLN